MLLACCWTGSHYLLADWATQGFWPKSLSLLLVIAVAGAAFFACANALRITEVQEIAAAFARRLRRRG